MHNNVLNSRSGYRQGKFQVNMLANKAAAGRPRAVAEAPRRRREHAAALAGPGAGGGIFRGSPLDGKPRRRSVFVRRQVTGRQDFSGRSAAEEEAPTLVALHGK